MCDLCFNIHIFEFHFCLMLKLGSPDFLPQFMGKIFHVSWLGVICLLLYVLVLNVNHIYVVWVHKQITLAPCHLIWRLLYISHTSVGITGNDLKFNYSELRCVVPMYVFAHTLYGHTYIHTYNALNVYKMKYKFFVSAIKIISINSVNSTCSV